MAGTLERLASKLADDVMAAQKETGNDRLFTEIGRVLGEASQTLEEAFLTEFRIRLAEGKAREFLGQYLATERGKTG